jgi:hypothetical protein
MSASVIDAFFATLGLDGTNFRRGMKDAENAQDSLNKKVKRTNADIDDNERELAEERRKRAKEEEESAKKRAEAYKKVRNELLGLAAVFTAGMGIKDFVSSTINSAAGLGYLSANLRMSTRDVTAWQRASERANGSAEGIVGQLKESADTLAQLKSGFGPNEGLQNFFRFGGKESELKDGNTYLLARSRIIAEMFKQDPSKAALIAKSMGIGDEQFDLLKQGPEAVMALVHAQEKNAAVSEKDAAAALALRNKVLDLRDSLQAASTRIVLQLAPALESLFAKLEKGATWLGDHKEDIARWVDKTVKAVVKFAEAADKAATMVGGWKNILIGLSALAFTPIIAGLVGIAGAFGSIVAAAVSIPGLVVALGALAAYAGWKGAEMLFGDKKGDDLRKKHKEILNGDSTGKIPMPSKSEMKAAAEHDLVNSGLARIPMPSKAAMKAEAERQMREAGLTKGGASGTGKGAQAVDKLVAMGWTREQAAGIAGSFMQESNLDPTIRNPKSGAYGIGQWLGSRVGDFKKFAGRDLEGSSLDQQLAFFNYEVTQGNEGRAGTLLKGATTAEDAARIHSEAYERPGKEEANIARRQRIAASLALPGRIGNADAAASVAAMGPTSLLPPDMSRTSTSKTDVRIDNITVNTQATDAQGVAAALGPAIEKYNFATQANTGMR